MIILDEYKAKLLELKKTLSNIEAVIAPAALSAKIDTAEAELSKPGAWDDAESSGALVKQISSLKEQLGIYQKLKAGADNLEALLELAVELGTSELEDDILSGF